MKENFKTFKIKYRADFIGNEDGNVIYVWISKPSNSDTQHVEKFLISEAPQKEYTDPNENIILFFELKNQKKYFIEFYLEITLKKQNDKLTASLNQCLDINYNKNMPFVKSEKYLEQSNELKELANKIVGQQKNTFETIEKIFKFVMKNFTYRYPVKNRGVKNMNFDSLKGDCAEYASLFVALCRNFKIPSQNKTGFVVFPKTKKIIEHG